MSRNMDPAEVPRYHCMPDNRGAMATPPWSNAGYLLEEMKAHVSREDPPPLLVLSK